MNTLVFYFLNTITIVKTLKDRLIYARELRGMSQAELAAAIGCSQSTIGNLESGYRKKMRDIVIAARVLEVTADWLQDGKGPTPQKTTSTHRKSAWDEKPSVNVVTTSDFSGRMIERRQETDPITAECLKLLASLDATQKQAALARLREFVSYLAPPRNGQDLQVAG